jgi:hypothetical protein
MADLIKYLSLNFTDITAAGNMLINPFNLGRRLIFIVSNNVADPGCFYPGSGSDHCSIPDPGGKKAPDPGSATHLRGTCALHSSHSCGSESESFGWIRIRILKKSYDSDSDPDTVVE